MPVGDFYEGVISNNQTFPTDAGKFMILHLARDGDNPTANGVAIPVERCYGVIVSSTNPLRAPAGSSNQIRYSATQVE